MYAGGSPVTAMIAYNGGVLTAFTSCGPPDPQRACVHGSKDGQNLGNPQLSPRVYAGSSLVASILPFGAGYLPRSTDLLRLNSVRARFPITVQGPFLYVGKAAFPAPASVPQEPKNLAASAG
jgi:hypothetical protein